MNTLERTTLAERLINSLINDLEINPHEFFCALQNAMCHGNSFPDAKWGDDDERLTRLHMALDAARKAVVKC